MLYNDTTRTVRAVLYVCCIVLRYNLCSNEDNNNHNMLRTESPHALYLFSDSNNIMRFILHVNRKSPAFTYFEIRRGKELPQELQDSLLKLGFETDWGDKKMLSYSQHHHGHAPHQWSFAMDLMSLGFDFLNDQERVRCKEGETSLMQLNIDQQTMGFSIQGHDTSLTLNLYQQG